MSVGGVWQRSGWRTRSAYLGGLAGRLGGGATGGRGRRSDASVLLLERLALPPGERGRANGRAEAHERVDLALGVAAELHFLFGLSAGHTRQTQGQLFGPGCTTGRRTRPVPAAAEGGGGAAAVGGGGCREVVGGRRVPAGGCANANTVFSFLEEETKSDKNVQSRRRPCIVRDFHPVLPFRVPVQTP